MRPSSVPSPFGPLIGGSRGAVSRGDIGIDGIEHITPVGDVGHVLEGAVAIAASRGQELVGADAVGLVQVQRLASVCGLVDHAVVESAPGVGLRAGVGIRVREVLVLEARRLDDAVDDVRALVEHFQDLRAGHLADHGGVAEGQDGEHVAVGQQPWGMGAS